MALIVQKFGGTSVGNLERIQHVAKIVADTRRKGHDVLVVVSAMSGETDRLIDLAKSVSPNINEREYDALISTGEQVSAALVSMMLTSVNCPAISFNAAQVHIQTDGRYRKANITNVETKKLLKELAAGRVPVVAGFQGISDDGHITTIGRGGSDVTAVSLAAALKADECQIFTDVDGVYTTDPRVVQRARLLPQITFAEMLEMANLGAKVLQLRAVEFAEKYRVPLRVLSSFTEGPGTLITFREGDIVQPQVSGIAFDRNQAKLSIMGIPNQAGFVSKILDAIGQANIAVDMLIQNVPSPDDEIDFSFTVHLDDYREALTICQAVGQSVGVKNIQGNDRIAKLSVVGLGMKTHASVASKMFSTLSEEGINIHLITSSEVKISTVIDEKYMELGARILHTAFDLDAH